MKSGRIIPSVLFFLKIVLAICGLLCLQTNFKIIWSSSVKKYHWYFDRNCIDSVDYLGQYDDFNNINSSNPWAWYIFHIYYIYVCIYIHTYTYTHRSLAGYSPWSHKESDMKLSNWAHIHTCVCSNRNVCVCVFN